MANGFAKAWKYLGALFSSKVDEYADPKVQIQQAIEDAQRQHQALSQQAAAVIGLVLSCEHASWMLPPDVDLGVPLDVLRSIPGLTLVPLRGFESCCGGAGVYNLQHQELSADILDDKIASIIESGADTVVTANPGCIMQLGAGALLSGLKVDVVHPIELLDAAYQK